MSRTSARAQLITFLVFNGLPDGLAERVNEYVEAIESELLDQAIAGVKGMGIDTLGPFAYPTDETLAYRTAVLALLEGLRAEP